MIPLSSLPSSRFSSAISDGLTWSRCGSGYEVKFNNEIVASLRKTSFWSCEFVAETSYGKWTIVRSGTLGSGADILDEQGVRVAMFKPSWGGPGTLTFVDGESFVVQTEGWWRPVMKLTNAEGQTVVRVSSREKQVSFDAAEKEPSEAQQSRRLLMTLFAFYRMARTEEDAAVVTMVAAIG